ncbi:MAG TPA: type IV secretory system conjugative DNA transfer family protein [Saprospiraceae bacterium]|nr:type IV secretory system conjugative DNA transfer family protein [Saprospiraceae bacterium]
MFIGIIVVWLLVAVGVALLIQLSDVLMGGDVGVWATFGFMFINLILSAYIFSYFKRWQLSILNHLNEISRFGSATWGSDEVIADLERQDGIYIGGGTFAYNKNGHILTLGGTRGGKGVNLILPNLLGLSGYQGSWVIIDVKSELTAISSRFQQDNGQNVYILDPWGIHTKDGSTYNPLDLVANQTDPDNQIDDISIIAEMIVPRDSKGDQFWDNKARSLIGGMILHLTITEEKQNQTLTKIWEWLRLPMVGDDSLEELIAEMVVSDSAIVRATGNEYANIMHTSEKVFQSILATAQEKTDFLKSPALQKSLAASNFNINNITNGKTTLYVIIPPDKLDSHYQWLRLVMTTALRSAVRNHDKRITFLCDEFAALGYLPEMKTALSTYAGYNITMWPIVQDLGQLKSIYGDVWETFISNTAVRHFLSVSDVFSLEYISKLMGTKTTVTYDANDKSGKPHVTARALATEDEIRRASANAIFTLVENRPPLVFSKLPYYEMPTLDGLHDPNPYYKS